MNGRAAEVWTLDAEARSLRQALGRLVVATRPRRFHDITAPVNAWLAEIAAADGLLTLFLRHTSASLAVQENADPDVQADLVDALGRLAPETAPYRHASEGADDMPAHVKAVLTGVSLPIPVVAGRMDLGTWQAVYVVEHRAQAHQRSLTLHYLGA
ncbi:secondary thiamine-phosphate synthase enzyme YjbQ [Polymorphum gilvum]|uniref:Secondary thiamine-phosphate synthase enzyme n=1 Tax=Polymorphum gilvum (strain LMG 25793 / CGMCC 1.9160 / SL003B-26A1) TaxID=991905 RepID=F2IXM3_POLGS|nr:secondary thiamine-phosphate synthase enzyme YjbQ [Polymorphum gilvum]ADZ71646.1 Secondary thiamine-phosphate synthase enzyme [Polymorphum gilvum SL003B-26A1]